MNVIDKYIIHKKVKHATGYTVVVGLATLLIAIGIGIFLPWDGVAFSDLWFPLIAGVALGLSAFCYIILLENEDVSHIIGLIYVYPLGIALLSFLFLGERISWQGYVGVILTIAGAFFLSVRMKKVNGAVRFLPLILVIVFEVINEFSIKISTGHVGIWQGVVVNNISLGSTLLFGLFHSKMRKHFLAELHNMPWEFLSAVFAIGGIATLFAAMAKLPATIVSSVSALQPLGVVVFERIAAGYVGTMTKDTRLLPKLKAIVLIIIGVGILYLKA